MQWNTDYPTTGYPTYFLRSLHFCYLSNAFYHGLTDNFTTDYPTTRHIRHFFLIPSANFARDIRHFRNFKLSINTLHNFIYWNRHCNWQYKVLLTSLSSKTCHWATPQQLGQSRTCILDNQSLYLFFGAAASEIQKVNKVLKAWKQIIFQITESHALCTCRFLIFCLIGEVGFFPDPSGYFRVWPGGTSGSKQPLPGMSLYF